MPKQVSDMEIDEISLVGRPANQHARVVIAKAQEDAMPSYFREDGTPVTEDELQIGDSAFDAEGNEFVMSPLEEDADSDELVTVGKSAFGATTTTTETPSLAALRDELSKALNDDDRDRVLSKAIEEVSKLEQRATQAEQIAKGERDLRLEREYIAKAAEYNVPIEPSELGPVLMRMADTMSYDDCAVIHKSLTTAGEILFQELGYEGGGDNVDPFRQVEAYLDEQAGAVSKGVRDEISKAQQVADFYLTNPEAYDEYVAGLGR